MVYQLVFAVVLTAVTMFTLRYLHSETSHGSSRVEGADEEEAKAFAQQTDELALSMPPPLSPPQSTVLPFTPVTLAFKGLSFSVGAADGGEEKHLLRNINGFVAPGTLTALMGASGAGKTTLMDVLAGRKTQGRIRGEILINGYPKQPETFSRIAGYVEQTDSHLASSTVSEALLFSARLRLSSEVTEAQRQRVVDETMTLLELDEIRDRRVAGLSPGQLKRVTMGVELVANPSILFLDEPTTGLDSRSALAVVRVIRQVARTGRSVVCTIHQPSTEVFQLFDRLLLLQSGGFPVYFGDVAQLEPYLSSIPGVTPRPEDVGVQTWMLEVIGAGTMLGKASKQQVQDQEDMEASPMKNALSPSRSEDIEMVALAPNQVVATETLHNHAKDKTDRFHDYYRASSLARDNERELDKSCQKMQLMRDAGYARSVWVQYLCVQHRYFVSYWRNTAFNATRIFMSIFCGVLFGLVWFDVDDSTMPGLTSKMSAIIMTASFTSTSHGPPLLFLIFGQRSVFYREQAARSYVSWVYSLSTTVVELLYVFIADLFFVVPFYFLVGLEPDAASFFQFLLSMFLLHLVLDFAAQIAVAIFPSVITAVTVNQLVFTFVVLFAGLFIPGPDMPAGWRWVFEINPVRYALEMAYVSQFSCEGPSCSSMEVVTPSGTILLTPRQYLSAFYDVDFEGYWWFSFGYIMIILGGLQIINVLATRYISHIKR